MDPANVPAPVPTFTPGIGGAPQPAPAPAPAPEPAPQPAPAPVEAPAPAPQPEPQPQPIAEPAPQPQPTQAEPQPQANPTPEPQPKLSYDEYLESLLKDLPVIETPKPTDVNQEDPEGLSKFFDEFRKSTIEQAKQELQKEQIIQNAERQAWGEVFTKYPEIQENPNLRNTIHNIRMGAYTRGESLSPVQVADALVGTLHQQYQKGINDTNVQVRVQESQPLNGGGQPAPAPALDLNALHAPGQAGTDAAVAMIQNMMAAGKL